MIIPLNIESENIYLKIFEVINTTYDSLNIEESKRKGRPRAYTDQQIIACLIYQVKEFNF